MGKEAMKRKVKDRGGGCSFLTSCLSNRPAQPEAHLLRLRRTDPEVERMSNHRFSPVSEEEPCCNLSKKAKICLGTFCVLVVLTIAAVVGVLWGLPAPKLKEWDGKGTTPNFPEIVLGRCYTYTKVLRPELR